MRIYTIKAGDYCLRLSTQGGVIVDGYWRDLAIFRPCPQAHQGAVNPLASSAFPLVPFGNRIADSRFHYDGHTYTFAPNTTDPHYLHGDGWQSCWEVVDHTADTIGMRVQHPGTGYSYTARQDFQLTADGLSVLLAVTNTGVRAMPFGLGHHPYFPCTPATALHAVANGFWTARDNLPEVLDPIPAELDFSRISTIPDRHIDNGYEGWSGQAQIVWRDRNLQLDIRAPDCSRFFLFHPVGESDRQGTRFFCFEPMSHTANGHNMRNINTGLVALAPGESMSIAIKYVAGRISTAG